MKYKKLTSLVLLGLLVNQPIGFSAPSGGVVTSGSGQITTPSFNSTLINQTTNNLSINWNSFNINSNETVQFVQPSSSSIAVNNILSLDPSTIAGQLNANGQIVLVNPNGLIFSQGATLNVGGIVASGFGLSSEQFINGSLFLNHEQNTNGYVINNGVINAATGGSVTLVGTEVVNNGVITANLGKVNLAAGENAVLTFDDRGLFGVEVSGTTVQNILGNDAAIINTGKINSEGGQILLTADISRDVFTNAVNNSGIVSANSIEMHDGVIRITSSTGDVQQNGELNVSSTDEKADGGSVEIFAENINNSGIIKADGENDNGGKIHLASNNTTMITGSSELSAQALSSGQGGEINVLGDYVGLADNTVVDASGFNSGGEIHIGGGFQGNDLTLKNSLKTYVTQNVSLNANAIETGDGGNVIVWSNLATNFFGTVNAVGGVLSGNGGFTEISGKEYLNFDGEIDVTAINGNSGSILFDPKNLNVVASGSNDSILRKIDFDENGNGSNSTVSASLIETFLNAGQDVELRANNDITFEVDISITGVEGKELVVHAGRSIILNTDVNIALNNDDFTAVINYNGSDGGGVDAGERDVGLAEFTMNSGSSITTSAKDDKGDISITTGDFDKAQDGDLSNDIGDFTITLLSTVSDVDGENSGNITLTNDVGNINVSGSLLSNGIGDVSSNSPSGSGENGGTINVTAALGSISLNTVNTSGSHAVDDGNTLGGVAGNLLLNAANGKITLNGQVDLNGGNAGTDSSGSNANHGGDAGLLSISAQQIELSDTINLIAGKGEESGFDGDAIELVFNAPVTVNTAATINISSDLIGLFFGTTYGNVSFNNTVDGATTGGFVDSLTLDATGLDGVNNGNILFGDGTNVDTVGGTVALGDVIFKNTADIDINANFNAASLTANTGIAGTFNSRGFTINTSAPTSLTTEGINGGLINISAGDVFVDILTANGSGGTGSTTVGGAGGQITLASTQGDVDVYGNVSTLGVAGDDTDGSGGAITINSNLDIRADNVTLSTGQFGGNIDINGTLNNQSGTSTNYNLILNAGAGNIDIDNTIGVINGTANYVNFSSFTISSANTVTFNSDIDGNDSLFTNGAGGIDISANSIFLRNIFTLNSSNNSIVLQTDTIDFNNDLINAGNSTVRLQGYSDASVIGIDSTTNVDLSLSDAFINTQITADTIYIGATDFSGDILLGETNAISFTGGGSHLVFENEDTDLTETPEIKIYNNVSNSAKDLTFDGDVLLTNGSTISTGGSSTAGDILFVNTITAFSTTPETLTLEAGTGSVTFSGAVGLLNTGIGALSITSAASVDVDANIFASSFGSTSTTGFDSVDFAINTGGVDSVTAPTAGGNINITSGVVKLGVLTTSGGSDTDGLIAGTNAGTVDITSNVTDIQLNGSINSIGGTGSSQGTGGTQTYTGNVTLYENVTLNTGATTGDIDFKNTVNVQGSPSNETLGLTAGGGDVFFRSTVGDLGSVGALTISSAKDATFTGAVVADSITQTAGTGTTTFSDAVTTNTATGLNLTGTNFSFANTVTTTAGSGVVSITNSGLLNLLNTSSFTLGGAFSQINSGGTGTVNLGSNIGTSAGIISFANVVTLTDNISLTSGGAAAVDGISFGSTVDSDVSNARTLGLTAASGDIVFTGAVGTGVNQELGAVSIVSANDVTLNAAFESASFVQTAGAGTTFIKSNLDTSAAAGIDITTNIIDLTGGVIASASNPIRYVANTLTFGTGTTDAGTSTVTLRPRTVSAFTLGTSGFIDSAGFNSLTANEVIVGSSTYAQNINVTGLALTSPINILTIDNATTNVINLGGALSTTNSAVNFNSKTTVTANSSVNTGNANITFTDDVSDTDTTTQTLGLTAGTGSINFNSTVGANGGLGALTISSANDATFTGAVVVDSITQSAGTGTTTFSDTVTTNTATGINLSGTNFSFANTVDTTTGSGVVAIANSGLLNLQNTSPFNLGGAFTQTGTGAVNLGSNIATSNGVISFAGAVTLTDNITLNSGGATTTDGISFGSSINGTTAYTETLNLTAGAGDITFTAAVGTADAQELGAVTINTANDVTLNAAFESASLVQTTGTGTTSIKSNLNTDAAAGINITTNAIDLTGAVIITTNEAVSYIADTISFGTGTSTGTTNAGTSTITLRPKTVSAFTLGVDGFIDSAGFNSLTANEVIIGSSTYAQNINVTGLALTSPINILTIDNATTNVINLGGALSTTNSAVNFNSKTTVTANSSVNTGNANITFTDDVSDTDTTTQTLGLTAGTGSINFNSTVGANGGLGALTISSANDAIFTGAVVVDSITQSAGTGTTTFSDTVTTNTATGLNLAGNNFSFANTVDTTTGSGVVAIANSGLLNLQNTSLFNLGGAFTQTGTGAVNLGSNIATSNGVISFAGAVTLTDNITLNSGGATTTDGISFGSSINGTTAYTETLNLTAGAGDITFTAAVGTADAQELGAVTINTANDVTLNAAFESASLVQTTGTGTTSIKSNLNTDAAAGINITTSAIDLTGAVIITTNEAVSYIADTISFGTGTSTGTTNAGTSTVTIRPPSTSTTVINLGVDTGYGLTNAELNSITAAEVVIGGSNHNNNISVSSDISLTTGALTLDTSDLFGISLGANITTTNSDINLNSDVTTTALSVLNTGAGSGDIASTEIISDTGNFLSFSVGTGNVSLNNVANNFNTLNVLAASSASISDVDSIIVGNVNVTGTLEISFGQGGGADTDSLIPSEIDLTLGAFSIGTFNIYGGLATNNIISVNNSAHTWVVNALGEGSITNVGSDVITNVDVFTGIKRLNSGTGNDGFTISNDAISLEIYAGNNAIPDDVDTLSFTFANAAWTGGTPDGVIRNTTNPSEIINYFEFESASYSGGDTTGIIGPNGTNTWDIFANNTVQLTDKDSLTTTYTDISVIFGGTGNDTFNFDADLSTSTQAGIVDGGGGNDVFNLNISSTLNASGTTLTGGDGDDNFKLTGLFTGYDISGNNNTIVGDEFITTGVNHNFNVTSSDGGNVDSNSFSGIELLTGNGSNDTLTVNVSTDDTTTNTNAVWLANATPTVTINDLTSSLVDRYSFSGMENLTGGDLIDTFTISVAVTGAINGGSGNDVFNINTNTAASSINGGAGDDDFVIGDGITGNEIHGNANNDEVIRGGTTNSWSITTATGGAVNANTFDDIEVLTGNGTNDTLTVNVSTTSGVTDTNAVWDIDTAPTVTINDVSDTLIDQYRFTGMENLTGGDLIDNFTISSAITGDISGGNGADVFTIGLTAAANNFNGGAGNDIFNINANNVATTLNGGADNDVFNLADGVSGNTLHGDTESGTGDSVVAVGASNAWSITASDSGAVDGNTFDNIEILTGNGTADTLTVNVSTVGGATDTNAVWVIDATPTVTINNLSSVLVDQYRFTGMENLTGGDLIDNFTISSAITGDISGGNGADTFAIGITNAANSFIGGAGNDIFNINANNVATTLNGGADNDVFNLADGVTGNILHGDANSGAGDSVVVVGASNAWSITASDSGAVDGNTFDNIEVLTGNGTSDTLTVNISTVGGATDTNAVWQIDATPTVTINDLSSVLVDQYSFTGMENLIGGDLVDDFTISSAITGNITGGNGADTFAIGITNAANSFIGGAGNDIFNINANNVATTLNGGADNDVFNLADGVTGNTLHGDANSGAGDSVIAVGASNAWSITASDGGAVDGNTFDNIEVLTGNGTADTLTVNVANTNTAWTVNGAPVVTINTTDTVPVIVDQYSFTNMENLVGGDLIDTFTITTGISGDISGGSANDVFNINVNSAANTINGGAGDDRFNLNASSGSISVNGDNDNDSFYINVNSAANTITGGAGDDDFIIADGVINNALHGNGEGVDGDEVIKGGTSNAWSINAADGGAVNTNTFDGIEVLTGNGTADTLTVNVANTNTMWTVNGAPVVTINTTDTVPVIVDQYSFTNMENLVGGDLIDTFTITTSISGDISGGSGNDVFNIDVNSAANTINGGGGDDDFIIADGVINNTLHGNAEGVDGDEVIKGGTSNAWSINAADGGAVNTNTFDGIEVLTGNGTADTLTVNVTNTNTMWTVNGAPVVTINTTYTVPVIVDQYSFTNMENLVGGDLVDTFEIASLTSALTINGQSGADILNADLIANVLIIDNSSLGNGSISIGTPILTFNDIQIFEDSGQTDGDFVITGPSTGTNYIFDAGGSVSFGNLSFSNVDILNAGVGIDTLLINGDFGGTINGMGAADIFQINTAAMINSTVIYGHDISTVNTSNDYIEGVYISQTGTLDYIWEIDTATSGKINGALFNDIGLLNGSTDNNITDTLISNIATNTWQVDSVDSTVSSYTFNNMENLTGGSLVDTFIFDSSISGFVNGGGGNDIFNINVSNAVSGFFGGAGIDTFNVIFSNQSINIDGGTGIDTIKFNGLTVDSSTAVLNTNNVTFTHADSAAGDTQITVVTTVETVEDYTAATSSSLLGSADSDTFGLFNSGGFNLAVNVTPELNIFYDVVNDLTIDMAGGADSVNIDADTSFNGVLNITAESIASTNDSTLLASAIILNGFDTVGAVNNGLNVGSVVTDGTLQLTIDNALVTQATNVYFDFIDSTNLVSASVAEDLNINTIASITASGTVAVAGAINISGNSSVDVDLNNAANDFSNISLSNLGSVSLVNTNPILLSNVSVNNLSIDTVGGISSTTDLNITGNLTLDTNSNISDISLISSGNTIASLDIVQANNATISNSGALVLGDINLNGDLALTLDGALTQTGAINASTLNVNLTGVYDVNLMNSNDIDNLVVINAGSLSINDVGGLSVGAIDATTVLIETTGSVNQTAAWLIDNGLTITMNPGDSLVLTDTGNVINGSVAFNTTAVDGFFNNLSFYNDGNIVLGSVNVTNALDIKSNGTISVSGDINIGLDGSASFDTDLDNSGDLFNVLLSGNNSLSNLIVTSTDSLNVSNRDSLTLDGINLSGDLTLQINPDNDSASYRLDNTGDIFVGGDTVITMSDGDVVDIGNSSSINLAGDTNFNVASGTLDSLSFTSLNILNLINTSLITESSLTINSDVALVSDLLLQSNTGNVTHSGNIDGFINLAVNALEGNIEFTDSMIGMMTALDTVNMSAETINVGKINATNGITLVSSVGDITLDQLFSGATIDLTSAANITSSTFETTLNYSDITADRFITNSANTVSGLNGSLQTEVNNYSGIISGVGDLLINNIGSITLSGINVFDGNISITASGSINQTGDIVIQQGTHTLALVSADEITMFEPAVSIINHGSIIYDSENTITISELEIARGDGVTTDSILIDSNLGDIATTNTLISLENPDVTANVVTFIAFNGSLGVGAQQFVIDANKSVTIATAFSNLPLYVVTPELGVFDSSTVIRPTDTSSLLGGDQRTQFSELSTVDPTIFTEVRNFEEDETAILLPEDQLYSAKL